MSSGNLRYAVAIAGIRKNGKLDVLSFVVSVKPEEDPVETVAKMAQGLLDNNFPPALYKERAFSVTLFKTVEP